MNIYRIENGQGQYWTGSKWSRVGRLYTRAKRANTAAEKAKGIVTSWGLQAITVEERVEVPNEAV